jgi:hypothetical protein
MPWKKIPARISKARTRIAANAPLTIGIRFNPLRWKHSDCIDFLLIPIALMGSLLKPPGIFPGWVEEPIEVNSSAPALPPGRVSHSSPPSFTYNR